MIVSSLIRDAPNSRSTAWRSPEFAIQLQMYLLHLKSQVLPCICLDGMSLVRPNYLVFKYNLTLDVDDATMALLRSAAFFQTVEGL